MPLISTPGHRECCEEIIENICVYRDQDGYIEFYNSEIKTPDILVFAGTIVDRYLSSKWKQFFDRSFFNGHSPMMGGKQMGFILSGPLAQIPNLRQIMEGYTGVHGANLVDFVTDECGDSEKIDALLENLAERVVRFSQKNYLKPANFLTLGGKKVFRDDIWGRMRFVFQADHRFYREHGLYDFPQKNFGNRGRNVLMMALTRIPAFKKVFQKSLEKEMIKPHQKILGD